jgi:20S proteasome alpha/beta subunit
MPNLVKGQRNGAVAEQRRRKRLWEWPECEARKVTIAIGLLTEEIIVLAADTEESAGAQKAETSKFVWQTTNDTQMVIAGAGADCHIETMAEILGRSSAGRRRPRAMKN